MTRILSRRSFMPLVAATLLSPAAIVAARAQGAAWEMYRRDDLGFEVDMPGKPEMRTEESADRNDPWIKTINAGVDYEATLFSANYQEFQRPLTLAAESAAQRQVAQFLRARVVRETTFTMNGIDALEIVKDGDSTQNILRIVMVANRRIMVSATGGRSIHASATVQRFLGSFKLLPGQDEHNPA